MLRPGVVIVAAFVAVALIMLLFANAQAQNPDTTAHERYHMYYQGWKQPGNGYSCCNANEYMDTLQGKIHISGDCEPTQAEVRNGDWWARVPAYMVAKGADPWIKIPDELVLHERNPSTEEGHLCLREDWSTSRGRTDYTYSVRVLCFVPPDTGG